MGAEIRHKAWKQTQAVIDAFIKALWDVMDQPTHLLQLLRRVCVEQGRSIHVVHQKT